MLKYLTVKLRGIQIHHIGLSSDFSRLKLDALERRATVFIIACPAEARQSPCRVYCT
jgi:hypothetical protein